MTERIGLAVSVSRSTTIDFLGLENAPYSNIRVQLSANRSEGIDAKFMECAPFSDYSKHLSILTVTPSTGSWNGSYTFFVSEGDGLRLIPSQGDEELSPVLADYLERKTSSFKPEISLMFRELNNGRDIVDCLERAYIENEEFDRRKSEQPVAGADLHTGFSNP